MNATDHVIVVLGHREPGVSAEHRISSESLERLARAARLADRRGAKAVILTGYSATDGLSEAEQMAAVWPIATVPVLCETGARDTANNAALSLSLALALGAQRVTVVSSVWHLRVRYFFAPWRQHGLHVDYAWAWLRGGWTRMLRHELRCMRTMRLERARAYARAGEPLN